MDAPILISNGINSLSQITSKKLLRYTICATCKKKAPVYFIEYENPLFNQQKILCSQCMRNQS